MPHYKLHITPQAVSDILDLRNYIINECYAESTAANYIDGIYGIIESLQRVGGALSCSQHKSLIARYGYGVKTIPYKKVVVIFKIILDTVVVYRVMAGALII
ncbi:hypothetical protein FACS1894156_6100 [Bacteroidia bacterium]|nr:hypothetical protein FACS1894156_6100 [Bacteroidia bacterium]